ncbi:hypothetical protein HDU76_008403 [Blyttiomyces sp. JEL0837]|nr:hypothetical protein HDU76_008403 [Blyttiomyces sp. JEL0837]
MEKEDKIWDGHSTTILSVQQKAFTYGFNELQQQRRGSDAAEDMIGPTQLVQSAVATMPVVPAVDPYGYSAAAAPSYMSAAPASTMNMAHSQPSIPGMSAGYYPPPPASMSYGSTTRASSANSSETGESVALPSTSSEVLAAAAAAAAARALESEKYAGAIVAAAPPVIHKGPLPPQPVKEEPPAKKFKGEPPLPGFIPEEAFMNMAKTPITLTLHVAPALMDPSVSSKHCWRFSSNNIPVPSIFPTTTIGEIKERVHTATSMPSSRIKLTLRERLRTARQVMRDAMTAAYYNLTAADIVEISVKERGGKK